MSGGISTAEDLFEAVKEMPSLERVRFFTLLGEIAFNKETFLMLRCLGTF